MSILHLFRRARRYLGVYVWLVRQHLRFHPVLFTTQLALAVAARLGTIAGLVICAHFLAHLIVAAEKPSSHMLGMGLELSDGAYKAVMVLAPVLVLLAATLCQYLAARLFGLVLGGMTSALARDYAERMSGSKLQVPLETGAGYSRLVFTLQRIELQFLMLLQNVLVLGTVILGSVLIVGPLIALAVVLLLAAFVSVFLLFRQKQAHELQDRLVQLDVKRANALNELARDDASASGTVSDRSRSSRFDELTQSIHDRYFLSWSFRELSRIASLVVQTFLVGALLLYIATTSAVDAGQFARLVSFFVIMRFAFGTVQGVNANALALTPDYPSLVRIMEARDYVVVLLPQLGLLEEEEGLG